MESFRPMLTFLLVTLLGTIISIGLINVLLIMGGVEQNPGPPKSGNRGKLNSFIFYAIRMGQGFFQWCNINLSIMHSKKHILNYSAEMHDGPFYGDILLFFHQALHR